MMPKLKLTSAADARLALQSLAWTTREETVPLAQAQGRFLAQDVTATAPMPAAARAAMDGFAVRAADLAAASANAPVSLSVQGEVLAGQLFAAPLAAGNAVRIPTGGCLPTGADAVVPIEDVHEQSPHVLFAAPTAAGRHLVAEGHDVKAGQVMLRTGTRLEPRHQGVLAALGWVHVPVSAQPRVCVLSSGAEVCPPEQSPTAAQVRDVNQTLLAGLCAAAGAHVRLGGIVPDDPQALSLAVMQAVADSDVVILSAGTSVGVRDFAGTVIGALANNQLLFHGLHIRPGKPTLAAAVPKPQQGLCMVWGLPGFPVSAQVAFTLFVAPTLRRMQGALGWPVWGHSVKARLAQSYESAVGREDYLRVSLQSGDDLPQASVVSQGPALISGLLLADGFVVLPPDVASLPAGSMVNVQLAL